MPGTEAMKRVEESWDAARQIAATGRVYGRSTGVGANRNEDVPTEAAAEHGLRLLRSHAGAIGEELPARQVRAMLAVRANQLLAGGAGLRPRRRHGPVRGAGEPGASGRQRVRLGRHRGHRGARPGRAGAGRGAPLAGRARRPAPEPQPSTTTTPSPSSAATPSPSARPPSRCTSCAGSRGHAGRRRAVAARRGRLARGVRRPRARRPSAPRVRRSRRPDAGVDRRRGPAHPAARPDPGPVRLPVPAPDPRARAGRRRRPGGGPRHRDQRGRREPADLPRGHGRLPPRQLLPGPTRPRPGPLQAGRSPRSPGCPRPGSPRSTSPPSPACAPSSPTRRPPPPA